MLVRDAIIAAATSSQRDSPHSSAVEHMALAIKANRIPRTDSNNDDRNVHPKDSLRVEPTDATTRASMTAAMPVEGQITLSPMMGSAGQCTGAFPLYGCNQADIRRNNRSMGCNQRAIGCCDCKSGERGEAIVSLVATVAASAHHHAPHPPPPPPLAACITMTTQ